MHSFYYQVVDVIGIRHAFVVHKKIFLLLSDSWRNRHLFVVHRKVFLGCKKTDRGRKFAIKVMDKASMVNKNMVSQGIVHIMFLKVQCVYIGYNAVARSMRNKCTKVDAAQWH